MAVEILPLGMPELGMTRFELYQLANFNIETLNTVQDRFIALLFAYVAAAYIAAAKLTTRQWVAANLIYVLLMSMQLWLIHFWFFDGIKWTLYAYSAEFIASSDGWDAVPIIGWGRVAVHFLLLLVSLWFAQRMRHPKGLPPAHNE